MAFNGDQYSSGDVSDYNEEARNLSLDIAEKRALTIATGLGLRTVERWFTGADQGRRLVKPSTIGVWVYNAERVIGRSDAIRAIVGELLVEGMSRDSELTGVEKTRVLTFVSLADSAEIAADIRAGSYDRFLAAAWHEMQLEAIAPGEWNLTIFYRAVGRGQESDVLTSLPEHDFDETFGDSDAGEFPWE